MKGKPANGVDVTSNSFYKCTAACVLCAVQSETVERQVCCVQCRVRL